MKGSEIKKTLFAGLTVLSLAVLLGCAHTIRTSGTVTDSGVPVKDAKVIAEIQKTGIVAMESLQKRLDGGHEGELGRHYAVKRVLTGTGLAAATVVGVNSPRRQAVEKRICPGMGNS